LTVKCSDSEVKTIYYFYLHFGSHFYFRYGSDSPVFDQAEYQMLEALCKKYNVVIVLFRRSRKTQIKANLAPRTAKWLILDDFPLTKDFPKLMRWPIETLTRTLRVAVLLRAHRPDLVDGNWITRLGGLYCALARYHPFLATAWGEDILVEAKKSRVFHLLGKLTIRAADAVIVDSVIQKYAVLDLGGNSSKICCFPRGIDSGKFKPEKPSRFGRELRWTNGKIVISTRNHFPVYGIENLIRAIPIVLETVGDAKFLIAGAGPLLEHHKSLATALGIDKSVKFLGHISHEQIPDILNASDVYVSTSFLDGSSVSLLEAMACGLPVVVTRIPGNEEWVMDGVNGFLVPPGNISALAKSVVKLLKEPNLRSEFGEANVEILHRRAVWDVNSRVFEKCVSDLLASRPARRSN